MMPAARINDVHVCPLPNVEVPRGGGPIAGGSFDVLIGGMPAARVGDAAVCTDPSDVIVLGSFTVMFGGIPAARITDRTAKGGLIVTGSFNVFIG